MNIIVPMAGMGKRMRPHTLTTPKPLIPIAGKPIVKRLIEDIAKVCGEKIEEVNFIIGDFGKDVEIELLKVAQSIGARGKISYQLEALGTAHAILCAEESLNGPVIVAFADTLFRADFTLDKESDGIIWVHKIKDPSAFGVVKLNDKDEIEDFVEKPQEFVSNLAIIGIYFFKDGEVLKKELQYLIDNKVIKSGEYQLTDALINMKNKGMRLITGEVAEWMDCGNKNVTVQTNQRVLANLNDEVLVDPSVVVENSVIIPPCYVGKNVRIINSVVGPFVSIEEGTLVTDSIITNSILQTHSKISHSNINNSLIGNYVDYEGEVKELNIGDYSSLQ